MSITFCIICNYCFRLLSINITLTLKFVEGEFYDVNNYEKHHDSIPRLSSGVPKGGEWGVRTPHFSKSWSSRFARKCNKISGGGRADLSRSGL